MKVYYAPNLTKAQEEFNLSLHPAIRNIVISEFKQANTTPVYLIPVAEYDALKSSIKNALDNSEVLTRRHMAEDYAHYAGGIWLDPADAAEVREAMKYAPGKVEHE